MSNMIVRQFLLQDLGFCQTYPGPRSRYSKVMAMFRGVASLKFKVCTF